MRRDGAANRESVLLAAEQVFREQGGSASTQEVARRAKVSIATVFRHFPTKQDLIEATVARHLEALTDQVDRTAGHIADPGRALATLVRELVSAGSVKMALIDLLPPHADNWLGLAPEVVTAADGFLAAVGRALQRAQAAGAARADVTVEDLSLLLRSLARLPELGGEQTVDRVLGIVLDGLGVSAGA